MSALTSSLDQVTIQISAFLARLSGTVRSDGNVSVQQLEEVSKALETGGQVVRLYREAMGPSLGIDEHVQAYLDHLVRLQRALTELNSELIVRRSELVNHQRQHAAAEQWIRSATMT